MKRSEKFPNTEISVSRDIFPGWGELVQDPNKIHLDENEAIKAGFRTTPAHGTLIAALAEQYVLKGFRDGNSSEDQVLKEFGIEFKRPLYPDTKANFKVIEINGNRDYTVNSVLKGSERGKVISSFPNTRFGVRSKLSDKDLTSFLTEGVFVDNELNITLESLEKFYHYLGEEAKGEIPAMYLASFIPAVLLKFSVKAVGKLEGVYSSFNLKFHDSVEFGDVSMHLKEPTLIKKRGDNFLYNFNVLGTQKEKPVLSGDVKCYSKSKY